ncbi:MAG: YgiQ family radical SAM protein [Spirochaetes bacterium]|nr:YgiQ family radical SAM protein [Spirochaetota bacterium]
MKKPLHIPITADEMRSLGWREVDVVIITGDAFVDHPAFGAAVVARTLINEGFTVGVIAQPDWKNPASITIFGKPRLFFGITSGNVDSMLARFTAFKKVRNDDPYSPEGIAGKRPQRAVIVYSNLVKSMYKDVPIVLGGIEASMRRLAHYDFWDNAVRRSILLDSRADIIVYGMGEGAIVEIAHRMANGCWEETPKRIRGTVEITPVLPDGFFLLPPEEEVLSNKNAFAKMYRYLYQHLDKPLAQPTGNRFILHNPPWIVSKNDLENLHRLPFTREIHPSYGKARIPAFEMIRCSIISHRGCVSGCSFCSLSLHHGKRIISRSEDSIFEEIEKIRSKPYFCGHITDIGGPSADMYGYNCKVQWQCNRESCLFPSLCANLERDIPRWVTLLGNAATMRSVKHVTIGSGVRFDLFAKTDESVIETFVRNHVGGQLKIAPEHTNDSVLRAMRKSHLFPLDEFAAKFFAITKKAGIRRYLLPYLMSCHPGCGMEEMKAMRKTIWDIFHFMPQQVQAFIPLPMTLSSVIYWSGHDPLSGEEFFVERSQKGRSEQHRVFILTQREKR